MSRRAQMHQTTIRFAADISTEIERAALAVGRARPRTPYGTRPGSHGRRLV